MADSENRSGSRSPHRNATDMSKNNSKSRSRSRSNEREKHRHREQRRNKQDLTRTWRDEMNEKINKAHSTHNKSAINSCSGNSFFNLKWHYKNAKVCFGAEGYYEELPPVYFDNIGIAIRVYPLFTNGHSGIGVVLVNKEEIMDRVNGGYDQPIGVCVKLGSVRIPPFEFYLKQFRQKRVLFKELGCSYAVWKSKNSVNFEFTFKKNTFRQHYTKSFDRNVKIYELALKHGELKIYSVGGKDFDVLDEVYVGRYEDKENNNNNNNNNDKTMISCGSESDECVRCSALIFASLGIVFENMVFGNFCTSKELATNMTMHQLKCVMWYGCSGQLHLNADPALHYALGVYLQNNDLKEKALRACMSDLNVHNVMRYVKLYDRFKVSKRDGLELLASWIRKMKERNAISDTLYTEISQFKYVENMV